MKTEKDIQIDFPEIKIVHENGKKMLYLFRQIGEYKSDLGYVLTDKDDAYFFASRMDVLMKEWEESIQKHGN